ncbi:3-carboxy-cis,cis-muconate cycloisomerase family FAD/NAD(P)-binding protein [Nocardia sp. NBC_01327]|uniref:3-carboxy-cis,cis-muconate cycloisomerase family FAD/NAD(P)-binding protein n=1 Tax=Nocardia sp. NBC_01327 TaxID=2903593 RepID=UPI002E0FFC56|nr:3-carboxy-cis,cis-muconate cycloisomerase family FAD/NAD(P)-binding protein [Nocardia sp. NBC_01327]
MRSSAVEVLRVAIVGVGPRGLNVFERICANLGEHRFGAEIYLVDSMRVGTGAVWRTEQSPYLLMNTVASQITAFTDHSVDMLGPVVAGPSVYEWACRLRATGNFARLPTAVFGECCALGPDSYPTRATYGHYLRWAYEHFRDRNARYIRAHEITATATDLRDEPSGLQELRLADGSQIGGLHAVVLAQGHIAPTTATSEGSMGRRALRLGLSYIAAANAADVCLDRIPAHEPIIIRGLGLTFFDYMALLTTGRGGRFRSEGESLEYQSSGHEPLIVAGSRRGVPHHARGENQKGVDGRHVPTLLTADGIDEFRSRAEHSGDLSFRRHVWPLIAREVEAVYYSTLVAERTAAEDLRAFRHQLIHAPTERELHIELDRRGITPSDRWDWDALIDPTRGLNFCGPGHFHDWLLSYLDADVRHAELGNVRGPVKAALDVLRDLRNEIRLIVDHGGLAGDSYRDDLDRWYTPVNAFLSIGPPARRVAELAGLIRAGVVRVLGPEMDVHIDEHLGLFVAHSPRVSGSATTASRLIDAWLPTPDLATTSDPLLRNLLRRKDIRSYAITNPGGENYRTGGIEVTRDVHVTVRADGRAHPRRHVFGVPTEAVHWVTAAGPRPGVNSVTLADGDRIARAILAAHRLSTATPIEGIENMSHDLGLLAPVRAGVPIAQRLGDDAWIDAMVDVELALARAQERLGVIPAGASQGMARALQEHHLDVRAIAHAARGAANPVVAFVEELHRVVAQIDPVNAEYVHWGATSQDIFDTATMLIAGRAVSTIIADVNATIDALARLAHTHRDTPVAGRTLAMHAVPTTLGAKVANWIHALIGARDRLDRTLRTGLPVQLGGAAGTFASYVECARLGAPDLATADAGQIYDMLTGEFAAELSMTAPIAPWHTVRTPIADLAAALAVTAGALGKVALDVITLARTEVVELHEPAAAGRGASSAMPQKRNPALSTLIRAAALQVPALASTLFAAMLAEDERPAGAWHSEWQPLRECLLLVGGAAYTAVELAQGLTADVGRMRANLELTQGQIVSERLSIRLAPLLGKSVAKKTLQAAAFEAYSGGRELVDVLAEDATVRAHFTATELAALLRPEDYLGAAPQLVDRIIDRARQVQRQ